MGDEEGGRTGIRGGMGRVSPPSAFSFSPPTSFCPVRFTPARRRLVLLVVSLRAVHPVVVPLSSSSLCASCSPRLSLSCTS